MESTSKRLSLPAILGGEPLRKNSMPPRKALGESELASIHEVLNYYTEIQEDPGYQGWAENNYIGEFLKFMGGGYADAVATGTSALFVSLAALGLKPGDHVLVSPISDPGTFSAIILNGLVPKLMDTAPGSFNVDADSFQEKLSPEVKAVVVVHALGRAADIKPLVKVASSKGIFVVEDCSQSHGASIDNALVGTFGDISAFSTMYRKIHASGGSGGVIYSKNLELFHKAQAHADRGKPRWQDGFDDRNPNLFLFPALNFHTDELSCAIGLASIRRLRETILRRLIFLAEFTGRLKDKSYVCSAYGYTPNDSPFVYPIIVNSSKLNCSKIDFCKAIIAEGIPLNPNYYYLAADWPWLKKYLAEENKCINARTMIEKSFMLYLNENYGKREANDCVNAILKIEKYFSKESLI